MELILARHGESEANTASRFAGHDASALTAEGMEQAARLGAMLAGERPIAALYASDLVRARQTAAAIAAACSVAVIETAALRERSTGELTGLTYDEARARQPAIVDALLVHRDPDARAPGGENAGDVHARVAPLLAQWATRQGRIVVVSHAFTLNVMLRALLGVTTRAGFTTDHCAVHRLELAPGRVRVIALNQSSDAR